MSDSKGILPLFSSADLEQLDWSYFHRGEPAITNLLRLLPGGHIGGYAHPNEARWDIVEGVLCFFNTSGGLTVRLDEISYEDDRLILAGVCVPQPTITLCLRQEPGYFWAKTPGTKSHFICQIADRGWTIGDHTYGLPTIYEETLAKLHIGKYTSFGAGVHIALGNHRTDGVSTYPFAALRQYWPAPTGAVDHTTRGDVSIGSDVWIGVNAFIGSGVSIGDGAVVGAHAVITRDVPPYAIMVGNPARLSRYRFPPDVVSSLLAIGWWNWSDEAVASALGLIMHEDITEFVRTYRSEGDVRQPRRRRLFVFNRGSV